MSTSKVRKFESLAVIGAGNMGSGIAQKMATEGFKVVLVDLDDEKVARGLKIIEQTLAEGVERKVFRPEHAEAIRARVSGTSDWSDLANVDVVVEAVFEDFNVKLDVFKKLDEVCRPDALLATNTSSMSVTDLANATRHPERVVGLHYFYHPAKNRLVEVVPGKQTDPAALYTAWVLQEQMGKTPIASTDASGFVVNRYFVPWLNEAVRLLEEGVADIATIEQGCKQIFGVGMGPFELMNVTGVPIALHSATTLSENFGSFYAPAPLLAKQVESGENWSLEGTADESKYDAIADRMLAGVFQVAAALVEEGVGTIEDTDIGARVGLRWPKGPFELMNRFGVDRALGLVEKLAERWELPVPAVLIRQAASGKPFKFKLIRREDRDGIATLFVNRPDAMNALNEGVVEQLHAAFKDVVENPDIRGIVIAGAGKAFIAGADIRFFVRNIKAGSLDRIVSFTEAGHALLRDIDNCKKPVVARMHGLALGGGLELALACDKIVASTKASLAFPETGIGIYPGLGGTQRTPRRTGAGLAKWLIFAGPMINAKTAAEAGVVDRVVPPGELDAAVLEAMDPATSVERPERSEKLAAFEQFFDSNDLETIRTGGAETGDNPDLAKAAKQIGFKAPIALRLAETLIDASSAKTLDEGLQLELDHLTEIFRTDDALEGLSSLGRKRPEFKGR